MAAPSAPPRRSGGFLTQYFLFILFGFGIVTLWMNARHEGVNPIQAFQNQHFSVASFASQHEEQEEAGHEVPEPEMKAPPVEKENVKEKDKKEKQKAAKKRPEEKAIEQNNDQEDKALEQKDDEQPKEGGHTLAGLDCTAYGGPSNDKAAEMVYWSDIPSDNAHMSPFYDEQKFMTFEPDQGGWNNIRMSMETVLAMSVATGRTLVLPPVQGMYLLDKGEHRHHVSNFFVIVYWDKRHASTVSHPDYPTNPLASAERQATEALFV